MISELPIEIITMIKVYLCFPDAVKFSSTCTVLYNYAHYPNKCCYFPANDTQACFNVKESYHFLHYKCYNIHCRYNSYNFPFHHLADVPYNNNYFLNKYMLTYLYTHNMNHFIFICTQNPTVRDICARIIASDPSKYILFVCDNKLDINYTLISPIHVISYIKKVGTNTKTERLLFGLIRYLQFKCNDFDIVNTIDKFLRQ